MNRALVRSSFIGLLHRIDRTGRLGPSAYRPLTQSASHAANPLPPRPSHPDNELHHTFLKGSGPGGQKINKTNSAVQMTHLPTGIVVKSQATRSRSQNYKIARRILAEKVEHVQKGEDSRFAKMVERKSAKKRSREKKARRKYRALEEAKRTELEGRAGTDKILEGGTAPHDLQDRDADGREKAEHGG